MTGALQVFLREWATSTGVPILSIDYSLAPEAPYPRPLEEVLTVYCWVLNNLKILGCTGKKIVLTGIKNEDDSDCIDLILLRAFYKLSIANFASDWSFRLHGIFLYFMHSFYTKPACHFLSFIRSFVTLFFICW